MKRFKFYNRQSSFRYLWSSKWSLLVLLIIFSLVFYSTIKTVFRSQQVNHEIKNLENQALAIEQENLELNKLIQYLDSDEFGERESRLKLGMQKPGEQVVVILDNPNTPDQFENSSEDELSVSKNCLKWWHYFFN
ncbi:MAG: septum formation initiator family protein [Patescibacteria group bacterium]|jgi:cell division protein FtsB|nr:septum formation initiator family protein [Patescibacteria group bacterium]